MLKIPKGKRELTEFAKKNNAEWLIKNNKDNDKPINLSDEEDLQVDKIIKQIDFMLKDFNEDERSFTGVASNESKDRDGDIIMAEGWKLQNFKKNPVFLWAHNYTQPPVGKITEIKKENGELRYKVEFPERGVYPFADTIFDLYKNKFLRAVSVGFKPIKSEDLDDDNEKGFMNGKRYVSQELLEISGVPVPSNFQALTDKGFKDVLQKTEKGDWGEQEEELFKAEDMKPYENEHACRLKDPGQYATCRRTTRTSDGKKYSIITCQRKDDKTKWEEQAFRYNKDEWTVAQARKHCKDHDGILFEPAKSLGPDVIDVECPDCVDGKIKIEIDEIKVKPKMESDDLTLPLKLDDQMIEYLKILKSGRVISEKNRKVINTAIDSMNNATSALKALLAATEPSNNEEEDGKTMLDDLNKTIGKIQERINSLV